MTTNQNHIIEVPDVSRREVALAKACSNFLRRVTSQPDSLVHNTTGRPRAHIKE